MTQIDLANQAKGVLPAANVEDLTQALIDIGTLQGEVLTLQGEVLTVQGAMGDATAFMTSLNDFATSTGYPDFLTMFQIVVSQVEANRIASGAAPVPGYIPPP